MSTQTAATTDTSVQTDKKDTKDAKDAKDTSTPFTFQHLPNEITYLIANHIFQAAVEDQTHNVSSLACSRKLESILSEELAANTVLRNIHAARSFPELGTALAEVQNIFPMYQQGCLMAALRLMPKLGPPPPADDPLWSQLGALLPQHAQHHDGATTPRDTAVLAMVEALASMSLNHGGCAALSYVLGLIGLNAPVSPQLASALVKWMTSHPQYPGQSMLCSQLRDELLPVAPLALKPRLGKLLTFLETLQRDTDQPPVERMGDQMKAYEAAQAAGDPDLRWQLRLLCKSWWDVSRSRRQPECDTLYRAFFQRLTPTQQMDIVKQRRSPLDPAEITTFLKNLVGLMPGTKILNALRSHDLKWLCPDAWPARATLIRDVVLAAAGTPLQDAVLEAAITYDNLHQLEMWPFLEARIGHADTRHQRGLKLRLGMQLIGTGMFDSSQVRERMPMSAEVDKLLTGDNPVDPFAIETLVDLNVAWLNTSQKGRLVERIGQLPPAQGARCLSKLFSQYTHVRSENELPDVQTILDACWSLPPQYRAGPVSALMDLNCIRHLQPDTRLLPGVRELFDTLPTALRPPFNTDIEKTMRQTPVEPLI